MTNAGVHPRRRRWMRFSLRGLFVVVTVLCVVLATEVNRVVRQREAVAAIEKTGGWVRYTSRFADDDATLAGSSDVQVGPRWFRTLGIDRCFVRVAEVHLLKNDTTDATLAAASRLPHVTSVFNNHVLAGSLVATLVGIPRAPGEGAHGASDAGLASLMELPRLERIVLMDAQVTDEGLHRLAELRRLKVLAIQSPWVTDKSVPTLAKMQGLKTLYLGGTSVSAEGAKQLAAALPDCEVYREGLVRP